MNRKYILYILLSFVFASCTGMNDIIQEYLDRGEINYIGKTDSIYAIGGKNKIQFKWIANADPRIEKLYVTWQNGEERDTLSCDVDRSTANKAGYVSHTFELPDMEGTFVFYTYHTGSKGYNSVPSEVTGTIYGDKYASKLKARRIESIDAFVGKTQLIWQSSDGSVRDEVTYTDNQDKQQMIIVKAEDEVTILPDHKLGTLIHIKSIYVPEKETIIKNGIKEENWDPENEFYIESSIESPQLLNLLEKTWEVVDFSSEESKGEGSNGFASLIIDNDPATFWHSQWDGTTAQLPHHLTIDMKAIRLVKEVTIARRPSNTDMKTAHIEVSVDETAWTPLTGNFEYPNTAEPNAKTVTYPMATPARFVKIIVTESHRVPFASIGEVRIYGTLE